MRSVSVYCILVFSGLWGCATDDNEGGSLDPNLTVSIFATGSTLQKTASHVTIDSAKLLLSHIVFMPAGASVFPDFKTGPFVVPLANSVTPITVGNISPGSYDRIKFEIHKPAQNEAVPDPDFRDGPNGNERYSLVIVGHYQGNRFEFKSRSTINQAVTLDSLLEIDDLTLAANVTLRVDMSTWFLNGVVELDPTDSQASNVAAIERSIRDSFRAFRDNNEDGI